MLRGIDVSAWQGMTGGAFESSQVEQAYGGSDFVIVKATEGQGYISALMSAQYARAKADGKLLGVYHYARGGSPALEAQHFLDAVAPYIGEAILVLDWESGTNAAWGSTTWARDFVDYVHAQTGIWPLVYTYPGGRDQVASCADVCALWIAGYPDNRFSWNTPEMIYHTGAWATWTIWQYSSAGGVCDLNVAQLDAAGWAALAGGKREGWMSNGKGSWWYQLADGSYVTGWYRIGDKWYYFNASGWMMTGWVHASWGGSDKLWWYMDESGALVADKWIEYKDGWYLLASDGHMLTGKVERDGKMYYLDGTGRMVTGWYHDTGDGRDIWYYFDDDGAMVYDCVYEVGAGKLCAFDHDGHMMVGDVTVTIDASGYLAGIKA